MDNDLYVLWVDIDGWYEHSTHDTYEDADAEGQHFERWYIDYTGED